MFSSWLPSTGWTISFFGFLYLQYMCNISNVCVCGCVGMCAWVHLMRVRGMLWVVRFVRLALLFLFFTRRWFLSFVFGFFGFRHFFLCNFLFRFNFLCNFFFRFFWLILVLYFIVFRLLFGGCFFFLDFLWRFFSVYLFFGFFFGIWFVFFLLGNVFTFFFSCRIRCLFFFYSCFYSWIFFSLLFRFFFNFIICFSFTLFLFSFNSFFRFLFWFLRLFFFGIFRFIFGIFRLFFGIFRLFFGSILWSFSCFFRFFFNFLFLFRFLWLLSLFFGLLWCLGSFIRLFFRIFLFTLLFVALLLCLFLAGIVCFLCFAIRRKLKQKRNETDSFTLPDASAFSSLDSVSPSLTSSFSVWCIGLVIVLWVWWITIKMSWCGVVRKCFRNGKLYLQISKSIKYYIIYLSLSFSTVAACQISFSIASTGRMLNWLLDSCLNYIFMLPFLHYPLPFCPHLHLYHLHPFRFLSSLRSFLRHLRSSKICVVRLTEILVDRPSLLLGMLLLMHC